MALTGEVGTTPAIKITTYIPLPSKETTERTERAIVCRAVTENYPATAGPRAWVVHTRRSAEPASILIPRLAGPHQIHQKNNRKRKKTEEKQAHAGANRNKWQWTSQMSKTTTVWNPPQKKTTKVRWKKPKPPMSGGRSPSPRRASRQESPTRHESVQHCSGKRQNRA